MPKSEWQYKARILRERPSNTPDLDSDTIMRMLLNKRMNCKPSSTIDQGGNNPDPISQNNNNPDPISQNNENDEHMLSNNHEEGEEQDSSNLAYHYEEEEGASANIGNSQITDKRPTLKMNTELDWVEE